jgi:phosphoribosylformylglycinamidine synthase subunit PurSL
MFNDFTGFDKNGNPIKISIPPTLLISTIGVVPDVTKTVSLDAKTGGDLIYILGETHNELGGSEFLKLQGQVGNNVPQVYAEKNLRLYRALYKAMQQNLVASAISVDKGGIAVALAKKLAGGGLGGTISINNIPGTATADYTRLFSESQGRILVTVAPQNRKKFEAVMKDIIIAKIGTVTDKPILSIKSTDKILATLKINEALTAYRSTFKNF